jgi:hypothetical protein
MSSETHVFAFAGATAAPGTFGAWQAPQLTHACQTERNVNTHPRCAPNEPISDRADLLRLDRRRVLWDGALEARLAREVLAPIRSVRRVAVAPPPGRADARKPLEYSRRPVRCGALPCVRRGTREYAWPYGRRYEWSCQEVGRGGSRSGGGGGKDFLHAYASRMRVRQLLQMYKRIGAARAQHQRSGSGVTPNRQGTHDVA